MQQGTQPRACCCRLFCLIVAPLPTSTTCPVLQLSNYCKQQWKKNGFAADEKCQKC